MHRKSEMFSALMVCICKSSLPVTSAGCSLAAPIYECPGNILYVKCMYTCKYVQLFDYSRGPTSFQGLVDIPESIIEEFPSFSNQTKAMSQGGMLTPNRSQMIEVYKIKDPWNGSCRLKIEVKTMLMRF